MSEQAITNAQEQAVLDRLKEGPVQRRRLLSGARLAYRAAYSRLLAAGLIQESGSGECGDPVQVRLPGQQPAVKKVRYRRADVRLMVKAGCTGRDAIMQLDQAVQAADGYDSLIALLRGAKVKIELDTLNREYALEKEKLARELEI